MFQGHFQWNGSQSSGPFGGNNLKKGQEKRRKCKGKGGKRKERSRKQRGK